MKSMTGFAMVRGRDPQTGASLQVTLRSVNGRYLETRFHLHKDLWPFEAELKRRLTKTLRRGTVDIHVHVPETTLRKKKLTVRSAAVKDWQRVLQKVVQALRSEVSSPSTLSLVPEVAVLDFANLTGVVEVSEVSSLRRADVGGLYRTFDKAVRSLERARSKEGRVIKAFLLRSLKKLEGLNRRMRHEAQRETVVRRSNLETRLSGKLSGRPHSKGEGLDPQRLAQEIIYYLDRIDVTEEMLRMATHLQACRGVITAGGDVGKKLDFFCQELLREVNTVGSKTSAATLTAMVVEAKTEIESLREQVQNIE
jgi:uncharacterized protein (TIGR00255 family)